MRLNRLKRRMEFSKKLLIWSFTLTACIIIFSLVMIWKTQDLSPLMYLIPAVFAEMGLATGFYYNKAKAENKIKLMNTYGIKPTNEDFREH